MTLSCPVCSAPNQACGHTELEFPPISTRGTRPVTDTEGTIYLPKQHLKKGRGIPGYKGENIKVVADPSKARAVGEAKAAKAAESKSTT